VSADHARLFVALELPGEMRAELARWSRSELAQLPGLRLIAPDSFHVTLCFLGSRPAGETGKIAAACRTVASLPGMTLSLGPALWLPPRRPRAVVIELSDEQGALAALQASLAGRLHAGGWYEPESRPFLGHVTVARATGGGRPARVALAEPPPMRFDTAAVTLYRSWLGSGPARYEALESVTLATP
jgi:2'-5' RNA ligase